MIKLYGDYGQHDANRTLFTRSDDRNDSQDTRWTAPTPHHISTSYVERQNLTIQDVRFGALLAFTNAFSKKLDNHKAACALHFAYYNFCRIHKKPACDTRRWKRVSPTTSGHLHDF